MAGEMPGMESWKTLRKATGVSSGNPSELKESGGSIKVGEMSNLGR